MAAAARCSSPLVQTRRQAWSALAQRPLLPRHSLHQRCSGRVAPAHSEKASDALTETLSGISKIEGRDAKSTNMVLGGDTSLENWKQLDEKVNLYPTERSFKAIGVDSGDFVQTMVGAVEDVMGTVPASHIQQRPSAKGKYVSVTIGPINVDNSDQVIEIYSIMRRDKRLRYYL